MILAIIVTILLLAVMELNKNALSGWILVAAAIVFYFVARKNFLQMLAHRKLLINLCYLAVLAVIFLVSQPPVRPVKASDAENPKVTETITVEQGQLTGVYSADGEVEIFAGIPYAAPPVGDLRWKEPQEPASWEGVRACDTFAPMSMQPTNGNIYNSLAQIIGYHDYKVSLKDNFTPPMSEDSLYLNIWRPAGTASTETGLPVVVYIHGGSLQTGQPWYADYAGTGLAKSGVIYVNMGYRLGVFGFYGNKELREESPNGTTGDYGFLDQIQALKWVQKNIAAFGGDPSNVTLAGESAGSACVSALLSSPLAKGLFRRAILESSTAEAPIPAHSYRTFADTLEAGEKLYADTKTGSLEELRSLPAEKLVSYASVNHHITPDGYVLEEDPYQSALKGEKLNAGQILHGYNQEESAAFMLFDKIKADNFSEKLEDYCSGLGIDSKKIEALYPVGDDKEADRAMHDILSGLWFGYGHQCLTRRAVDERIPVYEYYFTQKNGRLGNWHSGEEVYLYGNIPADSKLYTDDDRILSSIMLTYFSNFAKTGDPNRSPDGSSKVFDVYGIWVQKGESAPDLPLLNPAEDLSKITELSSAGDGTYVRETEVPYRELYGLLDEEYAAAEEKQTD